MTGKNYTARPDGGGRQLPGGRSPARKRARTVHFCLLLDHKKAKKISVDFIGFLSLPPAIAIAGVCGCLDCRGAAVQRRIAGSPSPLLGIDPLPEVRQCASGNWNRSADNMNHLPDRKTRGQWVQTERAAHEAWAALIENLRSLRRSCTF